MNKKDAVISVRGVQIIEREEDVSELDVVGTLEETKDGFVIQYTEYDSENISGTTVIHAGSDGCVSMTKSGAFATEMYFEQNTRHNFVYQSPYGDLSMGIFTKTVSVELCGDGGKILLIYNIDFNTGSVAENRLEITVSTGK